MRANASGNTNSSIKEAYKAIVMKDDTVAGLVVGFYLLDAQKYLCSPSVKKLGHTISQAFLN
jgi:hypothetical protein